MNEAYLKTRLRKALTLALPRAVVFRHEDRTTSGIPDFSVTLDGRVVWVEVKFKRRGRRADPTALQEAALLRLRGVLVSYEEETVHAPKLTRVVSYGNLQEATLGGYAHSAVAEYLAGCLDPGTQKVLNGNEEKG